MKGGRHLVREKKLDEAIAASTTIQRRTWPTPIRVPKLVRNVLIVVAVVTVLTTLVFVAWRVPSALVIVVGGFTLATLLSAPVRNLSHIMPRRSSGLAVLTTLLAIVGLIVVVAIFLVPRFMAQFARLTKAIPLEVPHGEGGAPPRREPVRPPENEPHVH